MKYTIPILGMHCASCAKLIERTVRKTEGVTEVSVNYGSEEAVIDIISLKNIERVKKSIIRLGYTPIMEQDGLAAEKEKEQKQQQEVRSLSKRVLYSAIATSIVLLLTIPEIIGIPVPLRYEPYVILIATVLATYVQFYGGAGFYKATISGLATGSTSMDTLIILGTSVAYGYSVFHFAATLLGKSAGLPKVMFYDSSTVIITLVLFGKLLEARAKKTATDALREITKLESPTAHKIIGNTVKTVSISEISKGDVLEIRPGERIPVDGTVIEGTSAIDVSMLTGEPLPVVKAYGDEIIAGTVNGNGVLRMRVLATGKDTVLSHIQRLVRDAQNAKPEIARLADSVSSFFVPIVLAVAAITGTVWFILGYPIEALGKTITVLVVACPCALGLATPMAVVAGVGRAAKAGVLIRTAHAIERAGLTTHVVFDKTGTITQGKPTVVRAHVYQTNLLPHVLAVESASEHPLASAIVAWMTSQHVANTEKATHITAIPGKGITGMIGNMRVIVESGKEDGAFTDVRAMVGRNEAVRFSIDDPVRQEAKEVITILTRHHMTPILLSGDKKTVACAKAHEVGITSVIAEVKPDEKAAKIQEIRKMQKGTILMVGDGINDAPALAAADVGVAIGSGTAIAKATADMTILANNLDRVPFMIHLSKATMSTIRQNLVWAFGYNIVLIPVAAGLLSKFGVSLTPAMAAAAMAASSLSVVLNSLRLSRLKMA